MEILSAKDYADAIRVQDACNLSGVVYSFSKVISKIWRTLELDCTASTEAVNRHPISVLYSSKIASLTGCDSHVEFGKAYNICMAHMEMGDGE